MPAPSGISSGSVIVPFAVTSAFPSYSALPPCTWRFSTMLFHGSVLSVLAYCAGASPPSRNTLSPASEPSAIHLPSWIPQWGPTSSDSSWRCCNAIPSAPGISITCSSSSQRAASQHLNHAVLVLKGGLLQGVGCCSMHQSIEVEDALRTRWDEQSH